MIGSAGLLPELGRLLLQLKFLLVDLGQKREGGGYEGWLSMPTSCYLCLRPMCSWRQTRLCNRLYVMGCSNVNIGGIIYSILTMGKRVKI